MNLAIYEPVNTKDGYENITIDLLIENRSPRSDQSQTSSKDSSWELSTLRGVATYVIAVAS